MRRFRIIVHRLRSLFRSPSVETDLDRKLSLHLDQLIRENVAAGMSEPEARLAARREFGGVDVAKEQCRDRCRLRRLQNVRRAPVALH
jgi:hypothetical protein